VAFKIGDRVRIDDCCGDERFIRQGKGEAGTILRGIIPAGWYYVKFDGGYGNNYPGHALISAEQHQRMPELESNLDDIILGNELYAKLEGQK